MAWTLLLIADWDFQWPGLKQSAAGQHILIPAACHFGTGAEAVTKPFSRTDENILKQSAGYPHPNKKGMATMQYILDLIREQSRSSYLAPLAERRTQP